jgi:phosphoglycolate phosphatase-like HAD superfamily hydrolase
MSKESPVLALDFDGVLCDSTDECVVTAWNAWLKHTGQDGFLMRSQDVPEPFQSEIRRLRGYVRTGGEYGVLMQVVKEKQTIDCRKDYEKAITLHHLIIKPFAEIFFEARNKMRKLDEHHWLNLHTVYAGIPEHLRELWSKFRIFVVTGKDADAVQLFFSRFDLTLPNDCIYDKDAGHDKLGAIRHLAGETQQPLKSVIYLDDNIGHLLPVHQAGCRVLMAEWGYHTDEDLKIARSNQVPIVGLDTWARTIQTMTRLK